MSRFIKLLPILTFVLLFVFSCRKDPLLTDNTARLNFSTDTVLFDTVFTTVGSATRQLKVYNPYDKKVIISSIKVAGGSGSIYRINVDGRSGKEITDVEIGPKDSLFIFIAVTVNPNGGVLPMIVTDSLLFQINGALQNVKLVAFGQDAYFYKPKPGQKGNVYAISDKDEVWYNDKPHVIYGYAAVDSALKLTIKPGTQVYFHAASGLIVYKHATLSVEGTLKDPVVFQGDRLEHDYKDIPGQWDRINLFPTSTTSINYAIIKNGNIGLQLGFPNDFANLSLTLKNTIVKTMQTAALFTLGATLRAENCVFANSGKYAALLSLGGDYEFRHCTFANYWYFSNRQTPLLGITNYYEDPYTKQTFIANMKQAYFGNCIMYGNLENELTTDSKPGADFNFQFDHCLMKIDPKTNTSDGAKFISLIKNPYLKTDSTLFRNHQENDYSLLGDSPAIDKGDNNIATKVPFDIKNISRTASPDLGAYERPQ